MKTDSDKDILVVSVENEISNTASSDGDGSPGHIPATSSGLSLTGSGELPYHFGNTGHSNNDGDILNRASEDVWEVNYREAAIFLEEGKNNDKFLHHPRNREALAAYLLVHSRLFNVIDLFVSMVVLMLGFIELHVPVKVHSSVELCGLVVMSIQLYLKV